MKAVFLLFLLLTFSAHSDTQLKDEIERAWADMDQAFTAFKVDGATRYCAPDFVITHHQHPEEAMTLEQLREAMSQRLRKVQTAGGQLGLQTRIQRIAETGENRFELRVLTSGWEQESADGPIYDTTESRDEVWIRGPGRKLRLISGHIVQAQRMLRE